MVEQRMGDGPFEQEIVQRLGLMPNLFRSAPAAPETTRQLWQFAKSAYLDAPLPALFKERLAVHLSRLAHSPYCLTRHFGFLVGLGRPAGDPACPPETIDRARRLLTRPLADPARITAALGRLEAAGSPLEIPEPGSEAEADLFEAASALFTQSDASGRSGRAIRRALGDTRFELLAGLLAYLRLAHFWTDAHPELTIDPDVRALARADPELAAYLGCSELRDDIPTPTESRSTDGVSRDHQRQRPMAIDDTAPFAMAAHQKRLLTELQHRVRNMIAVIRSIIRRTADSSESVEDFASHLEGRISALSRIQSVIMRDPLAGFDLAELIADELRAGAAREGRQVSLTGPAVRIKAKAAESIGLAMHELVTNALKYGALTVPRGFISIAWRLDERDAGRWLVIDWTETGMSGHELASDRQGFGTVLLEQMLPYEVGARVIRRFEPSGLRCEIALPADDILTD
ncbi:HWE histidine kinase domain-containing protein [Bradyrhizobium oligotrophicum]|uniref:HWE histidine kinase domain-containing protein n=1 Tax=Bradyrhizobium oligotrophicum TaxID=44255 RepID=UPI003EBE65D7